MTAKYQALDIANYILWYVNEVLNKKEDGAQVTDLSNLKLQKLLYYVAGEYLLKNESPLFDENIEKWQYGPVTPSVYYEYQSYRTKHIPAPKSSFSFSKNNIQISEFDAESIDFEDRALINNTLNKYVFTSPFRLVALTHQEMIWSKDRELIESGIREIPYRINEWLEFLKSK